MDDSEQQWSYTGDGTDEYDAFDVPPTETLTWTASEYIAHEKPMSWYLLLFGGSLAVTLLVYMLNKDVLTSVAIMTICFCAAFFASRQPASKSYSLNSEGLSVDGIINHFADFKSFSIVEEGAIDSIWLKPLGKFKPFLIIYFAPDDEDAIVGLLSNFLPHEQRELDAIDRMTKRLRF